MIKNINKLTIILLAMGVLTSNGITTSLASIKDESTVTTNQTKERCNYQIDMYVTAKKGLNLRTSPKVSDNKILAIPYGTKITTLTPIEKGWVKIVIHDEKDPSKWKDGYVCAEYLSEKDPLQKTKGAYKVTTDTLNMRSKAGTSGSVIGKLHKDDRFDINKSKKSIFVNGYDFREIKVTQSKNSSLIGKTGWIAIKYTNAPKSA